ncbi:MAG: hypothetical protein WAN71_09605 [Mycobacterium sp.]|uniref:hypothetical protein n=1 Tax=Mycobacterium sp. TaxID=1785 RepID=UPI003BAE3989
MISSTRYQLCVVAHDVGELVDFAGGWMCDRALAGWDLSVALPEPYDLRPLQIIGVTTLLSHQRFAAINDGDTTTSIAVTPGIVENNDHIRGVVLRALDQPAIEVTFWGPSIPSDLHGQLARRQYRLSGAARAFKAQALAAAAVPAAAISPTEDLYSTPPWYDASVDGDDSCRLVAGQPENR